MTTCEETRGRIWAWLDGELDAAAAEAVRAGGAAVRSATFEGRDAVLVSGALSGEELQALSRGA